MTAVLAGTCAACAVALALRVRPPRLGRRGPLVLAVAATTAAALPLWLSGRHLVLALVAVAVGVAVTRQLARARRRAQAEQRAEQVLLACEGLSADLAAGRPPQPALESAARDWAELEPVAAAARLGADVPTALRRLAELPGAEQLAAVAAAWQVAHRSGSGLAAALAGAARTLQDDRATRRLVQGQLAAARATARMMALLPALFLLLGSGLGGDPVGFLLATVPGLVCLVVGLGLAHVGVLWLDRIADRVLR